MTSNGGGRATYSAVEIGGLSNIISNVDASYAVSEGGIEMVGDEDSLTNITADYDFGYGISISYSHDNVFSNIDASYTYDSGGGSSAAYGIEELYSTGDTWNSINSVGD